MTMLVSNGSPRFDFTFFIRRHHPDFDHVGVGDGDATIRPVLRRIVVRRVARIVRQAMDHDRATRLPAVAARVFHVLVVRVGNLDREEEIAARVTARELVVAFRSTEVAGTLFGAAGVETEGDAIRAQHVVAAHEIEPALGFLHQHAVGDRQFDAHRRHRAGMIGQRVANGRACEQATDERRGQCKDSL
jgi:hypothetical protein